MHVRAEQSADSLWWLAVASASFGSLGLPGLLNLEASASTKTLVVGLALLFTGALVGCIRPSRCWRWGIAAALGFMFNDIMGFMMDPQFVWSGATVAQHLILNAVPSCIHAMPVLVGAYLGSYLMKV